MSKAIIINLFLFIGCDEVIKLAKEILKISNKYTDSGSVLSYDTTFCNRKICPIFYI
jgi:hypothetical protein